MTQPSENGTEEKTAAIIDPQLNIPQEKKDIIILDYEKILEEEKAKKNEFAFWDATMSNDYMKDFVENLKDEKNEAVLEFEHIKPAEFTVKQARVQAISRLINDFKHKADDIQAELSSIMSTKARYKSDNYMFLQAAGYCKDHLQETPQESTSADDQPQPEEQEEQWVEGEVEKVKKPTAKKKATA